MKITAIEIDRLAIPLRRPIRTSVHDFTHAHTVLVRQRTDAGLTGFHEKCCIRSARGHGLVEIADLIEHVPGYQGRNAQLSAMMRCMASSPRVAMGDSSIALRDSGQVLSPWG